MIQRENSAFHFGYLSLPKKLRKSVLHGEFPVDMTIEMMQGNVFYIL